MLNPTRERIDNLAQLKIPIEQLTFADIRYMYGTGMAISLDREYKGKNYRYRKGVMTRIGDIEMGVWLEITRKVIQQANEEELYQQLLEWTRETLTWTPDNGFEVYALELHSYRLFDNPEWVDYVAFNTRYRPTYLKNKKEA